MGYRVTGRKSCLSRGGDRVLRRKFWKSFRHKTRVSYFVLIYLRTAFINCFYKMNGEIKSYNSEDVTSPRLVYMKRGDQGYGFNLHGEKGVQGQTISAVDKGSPAEVGGLREGDRVIEVNGTNVENMKHGEVVGLIKQNVNETRLLVIDSITDKYLKEKGRPITEDMANLKTVYEAPQPTQEQTPEPAPVEVELKQTECDETQAEVDATPTQNGVTSEVQGEEEPAQPPSEKEPDHEPTPEVQQSEKEPDNEPSPEVQQSEKEPDHEPTPVVQQSEKEPDPEPTPEVQQDDSPKDAIEQINNVLEQEEKQPVAAPDPEPDVIGSFDQVKARLTGAGSKSKRKQMDWSEKKKWFDGK